MTEQDLVKLIEDFRAGNEAAREQLVASVYERLIKLSRRMLRGSSAMVQRWEETGDLAHAAWFRIQRALEDEKLEVKDNSHFFRLAARNIRFELIDIYRKLNGAQGIGANHHTVRSKGEQAEESSDGERFAANHTMDPQRMNSWIEFHRVVDDLPEKERTIVDLLWYQGLKQQDAADLLEVDVKTIKRRWRSAKLELADKLNDDMVEL